MNNNNNISTKSCENNMPQINNKKRFELSRLLEIIVVVLSIISLVMNINADERISDLEFNTKMMESDIDSLNLSSVLSAGSDPVSDLYVQNLHIGNYAQSKVHIKVTNKGYGRPNRDAIEKIINDTIDSCYQINGKDISGYKFIVTDEENNILAKYNFEKGVMDFGY